MPPMGAADGCSRRVRPGVHFRGVHLAAFGDYACDAAAHLGKVLLAKRDGVEERGGRHHESVDDVRLGDVLLELLVLDALHVIVVEALAGALARRSIDEVVVGVIEDQVGARRAADVDEEDVEDDAKVHRHVRRARLAWPVQREREGEGVWGGRHTRKARA